MKPLIQKLPISEQSSFVARTYTTPLFETTWHQHKEVELILQLNGRGMCFIGTYIGDFKAGDIFLLGSNLPHEFKKERDDMTCSVMVIHFDKDFWGQAFWLMPESKEIAQLLDQSMLAIKLSSEGKAELTTAITSLETATGFERITLLCKCLLLISRESNKQTLSTLLVKESSFFNDDKINKVFEYTINHFKSPIDLKTVALLANLSVPSFCRYFKKNTKKTYVEFLNEMRVGHACQALIDSDRNILEISADCGFNTISNFNKQFLKIKGIKPSVYKKNFKLKMIYK